MRKHYSVKEASKILGVSTNTLYKYLGEGKIKGRRIGQGRFKIPYSELFPYVSESISLFSKPTTSLEEALELFRGKSYMNKDFVFFELFLAIVFLGNGLLTLFYKLSIFTPTSSGVFLLIPLFSLVPALLLLLETFWHKFKKYHPIAHIIAMIVSAYSAYFSFSFGGYEVFSLFLAIFIVLVIEAFRGITKLHEKCFFEREFLSVLFISSIVWATLIFFKPDIFPILILRSTFSENRGLFLFLWAVVVELPLIALFTPIISKLKITRINFFLLPFLSFWGIVAAIFMSTEGKWIASFYLYIIAIFELFLLWWKKQEKGISAKLAPFVVLSTIWILFIVFTGVFGISFSQRSIINNKVEVAKTNLSKISDQISFLFETIDRRLTSASQRLEILEVISRGNEEEAISKSKEIFDTIPELRRVVIYDANGHVLGAYPRDSTLQGAELGNREYFQAVKSTKEPYTSDIFPAITTANVVIRIHPIIKGNEFLGAVAVVPDLQELSKKYNSDSHDVIFYGYDKKANYILHPDSNQLGKSVPEEIIKESKEEVYRDIQIFRVFKRIDTLGWTLFAQGSVMSVLQSFAGINIMVGILILVGTALGFGVILLAKKWVNKV